MSKKKKKYSSKNKRILKQCLAEKVKQEKSNVEKNG
jgi:hypothetical protein